MLIEIMRYLGISDTKQLYIDAFPHRTENDFYYHCKVIFLGGKLKIVLSDFQTWVYCGCSYIASECGNYVYFVVDSRRFIAYKGTE